jgi:hypothetical protein
MQNSKASSSTLDRRTERTSGGSGRRVAGAPGGSGFGHRDEKEEEIKGITGSSSPVVVTRSGSRNPVGGVARGGRQLDFKGRQRSSVGGGARGGRQLDFKGRQRSSGPRAMGSVGGGVDRPRELLAWMARSGEALCQRVEQWSSGELDASARRDSRRCVT